MLTNKTALITGGASGIGLASAKLMWTVSSPWTSMSYDPLDRLAIVDSSADTKFAYDGLDALAEYNGSDVLQRRFVFGPGIDEPLVQYDGSGTSNRTFMSADDLGSIISLTDSSGTLLNINRYDEYGKPQGTNSGRFQYTGQRWIGEAGLYDYKARNYLPNLGIFAQTDPIGYAGGINLYAYVGNDPINSVDPLGFDKTIVVQAKPWNRLGPGESLDQDPRLTIFPGEDRIPSLASQRQELIRVPGPKQCKRGRRCGHSYPGAWRVTQVNTKCTLEQAIQAMMDNAVPNRTGSNVSGAQYDVSGNIPGTDTITFQKLSPTSFVNTTHADHVFRYGTVYGWLSGNQRDGFIFNVVGSGSNVSALHAWANRVFGPQIFKTQARRMNQQLLSTCGG